MLQHFPFYFFYHVLLFLFIAAGFSRFLKNGNMITVVYSIIK